MAMQNAAPQPADLHALADSMTFLRDPTLSSYREQLVEYLFLSELLQDAWLRRRQRMDVLRADVDGAGYDLVAECNQIVRHIQLKSTVLGGSRRSQNIHTELTRHHSGCVVWVVLRHGGGCRLDTSFLTLGNAAGEPLGALDGFRMARHARANSEGVKSLRRAHRKVPVSAFVERADIAAVSDWLFGAAPTRCQP